MADSILMEHASQPTTILVIEDSPVVQHLLRVTLAALGVELLFAEDGETGLEMARVHLPDIVTLDIGLPGIDGWEVLCGLRADSATSHIGVIVLTAHAQKSMQDIAESRGADGFLTKPFQPFELRQQVEELLEQASLDAVVNL